MEIIKESLAVKMAPTDTATIYEYESVNSHISGAVAEINGRYPESGFCLNQKIDEICSVLSGAGKLITKSSEKDFAKGDVVLVARNEAFAWQGDMTLFIATTPKFDPDQHVEVE